VDRMVTVDLKLVVDTFLYEGVALHIGISWKWICNVLAYAGEGEEFHNPSTPQEKYIL
jgi:hypothetical protein